jgi:putative membrane protein
MNAPEAQTRAGVSGRLPHALLAAYTALWLLAAIKPFNRQDWFLENLPVLVAVPVLVATFRRFRFSSLSYVLMTAFLTLHAVGAHFTYTEMPWGNWLRDGWQLDRNHYDRVVHFCFGLMIGYPIWELLRRQARLTPGLARVATVHAVMAWSALYEITEAVVAHLVSPELGAAYNGIQGDIWDAQKDAALALAGVLLCILGTCLMPRATLANPA